MAGARDDPADPHLAGELGIERVGDVVLLQVAGAPARHIEKAVVHRKIDVGDQRRAGAEALEHRRQHVGARRLGRDADDLLHRPLVAVAIPGPDRGREILQADHAVHEAVCLGRVVRRAQLEHQLMLLAEVDLLQVLALGEIPEVQLAAVLAAEQHLGHQPVLERVGGAPFAGHHGVVAEMPPGVVGEVLRPAIDLPAPERLEALVIHHEHAARSLAILAAERRHVDAARPAMHGVRARIAGLLGDLLRLDHLDDLRIARVGLGVEDVDARGAQARHHQIAPLDMRVRHLRAQARRAGVPAEVVELVAGIQRRDVADNLRIGRRCRIDVDDRDPVGFFPFGIERRHVGEPFGRRLHRHAG